MLHTFETYKIYLFKVTKVNSVSYTFEVLTFFQCSIVNYIGDDKDI